MKKKTSRETVLQSSNDEKPEMRVKENEQAPSEIIEVDDIPDLILKNKGRYHPRQTRHILGITLVLSLLISIVFFGVLYVLVEKELVESLKDFSRYSITILSSLTATAIGFFFGRDFKES